MQPRGRSYMYHPYFRGKQYELITIREMAFLMRVADFRPIIEPVREGLTGLEKALNAVADCGGKAVLIVNPHHGDLSGDGASLTKLLKDKFLDLPGISAGILLKPEMHADEVLELYEEHAKHSPVLIHAGFTDAKGLSEGLGKPNKSQSHVFIDGQSLELYQRQFRGAHRVLIRDGFKRQRNASYPPVEAFSDLHAVYEDKNLDGFGDFLIVGDDFQESGGPA